MRLFNQRQFIYMVLATAMLSACATTKGLNAWRDKGYDNIPLKKVLVVSGLQRNADNQLLQDALVKQLKANGIDAIAGHAVFENAGHPSKEQIIKYAARHQVDAVLVSRITGENTEAIYHPEATYAAPYPYYSYWDTYYSHLFDRAGFVAKYKFYYLESNIYAVNDKTLIWTAVSQALDPKTVAKDIGGYANDIVAALMKSALI